MLNKLRPKIAQWLYRLAMRIYPHLEADKSLARQVDKALSSTILKERITGIKVISPETVDKIESIVKGYEKS